MKLQAKLLFDDLEFNVKNYSLSFKREVDSYSGKPVSKLFGGKIEISIDSDGNSIFADWAMKESLYKDGRIELFNPEYFDEKLFEISFRRAVIISYNHTYSEKSLVEEIIITAVEISINSSTYLNDLLAEFT